MTSWDWVMVKHFSDAFDRHRRHLLDSHHISRVSLHYLVVKY